MYICLGPEYIHGFSVLLCTCTFLDTMCVCVCRELEVLQSEVVESKLTMDGKQKVGVATFTFIATTLALPFTGRW